jgi:DICT domain-containing protein
MAKESAAKFYRQEAERLVRIARDVRDPAIKLELLQVAAQFQALAEHAHGEAPEV